MYILQWVPPPLKMLPDGVDVINEETCLIALLDGCDDDDQDDAVAVLDAVAAEFKAAGDEIVFMCTKVYATGYCLFPSY